MATAPRRLKSIGTPNSLIGRRVLHPLYGAGHIMAHDALEARLVFESAPLESMWVPMPQLGLA